MHDAQCKAEWYGVEWKETARGANNLVWVEQHSESNRAGGYQLPVEAITQSSGYNRVPGGSGPAQFRRAQPEPRAKLPRDTVTDRIDRCSEYVRRGQSPVSPTLTKITASPAVSPSGVIKSSGPWCILGDLRRMSLASKGSISMLGQSTAANKVHGLVEPFNP